MASDMQYCSVKVDNNCFFQNGQIFVFTGLLKFLTDDDSLSIILGHEIAHAILQHSVSTM